MLQERGKKEMSSIIRSSHVKTVRDGQPTFMDTSKLSRVRHDQSTHYYDLSELGITMPEWEEFVCDAFDANECNDAEIGVYDADNGTYYASL